MSSTNRSSDRKPYDFYPTPKWCVDRLLDEVVLPGGRWLEPGAGTGSIIKAVNARRQDVRWTAVEINEDAAWDLDKIPGVTRVYPSDFMTLHPLHEINSAPFQVAIGNPPYSRAMEFVEKSFAYAQTVVMLLRLNFLGSEERASFLRGYPPDVYVLPNRPSFTGKGTDSIEYAWFVWSSPTKSSGTIKVLNSTPKQERKAA